MRTIEIGTQEALHTLCTSVRELCREHHFDDCLKEIRRAMGEFPDAAAPHNLYGVVMEISGDHQSAMKHFRAAWSLDPTYSPVNQNLETYGTFTSTKKPAFDESDVAPMKPSTIKIVYDEKGIGHAVRKNRVVFDEKGVAHMVKGE